MAHRAEWSCEKTHLMMDFEAFMLLLVSVKKSKRYPCLGLASLWLCLVQGTKKKKKDASYYELAYIKCCRILNTFYTSIFRKSSKGTYKCLGEIFFPPGSGLATTGLNVHFGCLLLKYLPKWPTLN